MSIIIKSTYACSYCGSPYVEYHRCVEFYGLTLAGEILSDEDYVEDSDFCNVCGDYSRVLDATLIYTPDHRLLELVEDYYIDRVFRVYSIPHELHNGIVYFLEEAPILLAELSNNDFTRSIIHAITDTSLTEQHRLDLLNMLIDQGKAKHDNA